MFLLRVLHLQIARNLFITAVPGGLVEVVLRGGLTFELAYGLHVCHTLRLHLLQVLYKHKTRRNNYKFEMRNEPSKTTDISSKICVLFLTIYNSCSSLVSLYIR